MSSAILSAEHKMRVVLIHGQGRTPLSMRLLGWRLGRQGYPVHYFGYAAFAQTFGQIVGRFVQTIQAKIQQQPYIVVAHSLGSIITRAGLPLLTETLPRHLVMLAPPNQSPWIAKKLKSNPLYRLMTGDCGQKLADDAFYRSLPLPFVPTTIIAGTQGLRGRFSPFGVDHNDTILAVSETKLRHKQPITVPATHALIMNSTQVTQIILSILAELPKRYSLNPSVISKP